jgi:hypothetical protein
MRAVTLSTYPVTLSTYPVTLSKAKGLQVDAEARLRGTGEMFRSAQGDGKGGGEEQCQYR